MSNLQKVEISTLSILKFFGVILGLFFLWTIRDIFTLLLVVLIVVAALNPLVKWMMNQQIPRTVAVTVIYLVLFAVITLAFTLILSPLVKEISNLVDRFPEIVSSISPAFAELVNTGSIANVLRDYASELANITQGVFAAITQIFGGAITGITVAALSFYILVDMKTSRDALVVMTPKDYVEPAIKILNKIGDKIGAWVRGQVVLSFVIGVTSYIALLIINVPFALTLAVVAAILEIIPVVGPIIAGVIALVFAYGAGSWQMALAVAIFYVILQQIENAILVPKIMQKAVGLSPVIIIIALAVGGKLAGVSGAILAVPIATAVSVLVQDIPKLTRS